MQEGNLHKWFKGSKSKDGKSGWVNVVTGGTCASDKPGEGTPKCVSSSKRASMTPAERKSAQSRKKKADPNQQSKSGAAKPTYVSTDKPKKKMKEEMEINEADKKGKGSGKKDACYHKVKASASVWPSAYASGRLVQCRKKGAANYGKSKKNEEFMALPEFTDLQIKCMEASGIEVEVLDEKCWSGYTQKGMKKKGKKVVPNCVPVGEETKDEEKTIEEATRIPAQSGNCYLVGFTWRGKYMMMKLFFPDVKRPSRTEVQDTLEKVYPGSYVQRFDLTSYNPNEPMLNVGVREEYDKSSKSCSKGEYYCKDSKKCKPIPKGHHVMPNGDLMKDEDHDEGGDMSEGAAWTRKEGQNPEGGLNEKGRKSAKADGHNLKRPSKVKGNKRRASFCARMKGMKKKLTSAKTARDPDSRINKSLRAWECN